MKNRKGRILKIALWILFVLVLLIGSFFLLRPKPPRPPESVERVVEIETYLNDLVTFGTPPGISLVVVKNGKMVYSHGFGLADGPNNVPATPDSVYHWWSMTKIPTAIAIIQLQEQGLLNLDDPVVDYLPFFGVTYPAESSQPVTIRHLLSHGSGMPDAIPAIFGWIHHPEDPSVNQTNLIKEKLPDYTKLTFEPGTDTNYTNIGYMVLGAVIEEVSGQDYEDYVLQHILQPLSMDHTNFIYTDAMLSNAAAGSHLSLEFQALLLPFLLEDSESYIRERVNGRIWFNNLYNDQTPPTGLIGPSTDVAQLMLAYLNGGEMNGQRILAEESIAMMTYGSHIFRKGVPLLDYALQGLGWKTSAVQGLGWKISAVDSKRLFVEHSGGGPGFGCQMRLYPEEGLGIVIMANDTTYDRDIILDLVASLDW